MIPFDSLEKMLLNLMERLLLRSCPIHVWRNLPAQPHDFTTATFEIGKDGCFIMRRKFLSSLLDYVRGKHKHIHDRFLPFEPFNVCLSYIDRAISIRRFVPNGGKERIELEVGLSDPNDKSGRIIKQANLTLFCGADGGWKILENQLYLIGAGQYNSDVSQGACVDCVLDVEDAFGKFFYLYVDDVVDDRIDRPKEGVLKDV
jgi:hypothetical protein